MSQSHHLNGKIVVLFPTGPEGESQEPNEKVIVGTLMIPSDLQM
jgi:hypothetical protein